MSLEVIVDMNNKNALAALAYIKSNDNPIEVFCNYVRYAIASKPEQNICSNNIAYIIENKFGLKMKHKMIEVCLRVLKKKGIVDYNHKIMQYKLTDDSFNIKTFEDNFLRLQEQEKKVVDSLVDYVNKEFNITWTYDTALNYLSLFLSEQGNGTNIFMDEAIELGKKLSPTWYVGRFVDSIKSKNTSLEWSYLVDIVNGLMVYHGVYETNDYEQDKTQKFKGTPFYFDTKLVLRSMGFSWEAQVQMTKEFVDLITNEYGGKICVFERTITEVKNALIAAGEAFCNGDEIKNAELRAYAELNPTVAELFIERADSIKDYLSTVLKFEVEDNTNWTSEDKKSYYIEIEELKEYIKNEFPDWKSGSINNDVKVINQINILRKGNYSTRYGGKHKLPIFVTTNSGLVHTVKEFATIKSDTDNSTFWNPMALPVVSENMILYRLWVPLARKHTELPALTLSRYAYSAQNADGIFFETLKNKMKEYEQVEHINVINLDEARRRKLEDLIVEKTKGDPDNITEPILARSVDELVTIENLKLTKELKESQLKNDANIATINHQKERIIKLAAKPFYNKLGLCRILLYIAKNIGKIITLILYVIGEFISTTTNISNDGLILKYVIIFLPAIIEIITYIIDKVQNSKRFELKVTKQIVRLVLNRYGKRIIKSISDEEKVYALEIINNCIDNTPILKAYKKELCDFNQLFSK